MQATMMAKGILSWIPGVTRTFYNRTAAAGTESASYCYGVWLKHLTLLWANGMHTVPRTVLELGPGASIGTGVAALLSGSERYIAIDAVAHMQPHANAAVFHQLAGLFAARAGRPRAGFPPIDEYLDGRLFPSAVLHDARLGAALEPGRLDRIERSVRTIGSPGPEGMLRYHTWGALQPVAEGSVDLLFSQVVLNQVSDLPAVYASCARLVAPGGWMSHQVDFTSLNTAREWNGHLAYRELAWRVMFGNRPYFLNRARFSTHLELLGRHGFDVVHAARGLKPGGLARAQLAPRWRGISDEDLATQNGFFISRRR